MDCNLCYLTNFRRCFDASLFNTTVLNKYLLWKEGNQMYICRSTDFLTSTLTNYILNDIWQVHKLTSQWLATVITFVTTDYCTCHSFNMLVMHFVIMLNYDYCLITSIDHLTLQRNFSTLHKIPSHFPFRTNKNGLTFSPICLWSNYWNHSVLSIFLKYRERRMKAYSRSSVH